MTIQERTRKMALDSNTWVHWPFLPLKRKDELGVMVDGSFNVYLTNMFMYRPDAPLLEYKTIEEVLAAGWQVD